MLNKKQTLMDKEYTEFEVVEYTREYLERVRKTDAPSLEDFEKPFKELGYYRNGNVFTRSFDKVVGKMIVNGVENLQKETLSIEFKYFDGETADIDGDLNQKFDAVVSANGNKILLVDTVYARPEDMHIWIELYQNLMG
jgi:hypothetical protein